MRTKIKLSNGKKADDVNVIVPENKKSELSRDGETAYKQNNHKFNSNTGHWSLK